MAVYTVHVPLTQAGEGPRPDRVVFVRDGFHFWALLFGPLWLIWHRLWLALVAYIVVIAALVGLVAILRTGVDAQGTILLIVALLAGYEAASARRAQKPSLPSAGCPNRSR